MIRYKLSGKRARIRVENSSLNTMSQLFRVVNRLTVLLTVGEI